MLGSRWTVVFLVFLMLGVGCSATGSSESEYSALEGVTVTLISPTSVVSFETEAPSLSPTIIPIPTAVISEGLTSFRETLTAKVREEEIATGVDIALAVTDLQTGESIQIDGKETHLTGCIINLFAFLTVTREFDAGRAAPDGIETLISDGINHSKPPAVRSFLTSVSGSYEQGLAASQDFVRDLELTNTVFDHVPYYGGEDPAPNLTTVADTNEVLERLWRGELFSPAWTAYSVEVLGNSAWYVNVVLPAKLPEEARVAHKVGWFSDGTGWVENDVGIVSFTSDDGTEKAYAISFLSQHGPGGSYAEAVGSDLSLEVWDYFDTAY